MNQNKNALNNNQSSHMRYFLIAINLVPGKYENQILLKFLMNTATKFSKFDLHSSSEVNIDNLRFCFILYYNEDAEILETGNFDRRKETAYYEMK